MGIGAASQMINHIENPNRLATKLIVPHYLIERDSCLAIDVPEHTFCCTPSFIHIDHCSGK